jgi:hypothetical protein
MGNLIYIIMFVLPWLGLALWVWTVERRLELLSGRVRADDDTTDWTILEEVAQRADTKADILKEQVTYVTSRVQQIESSLAGTINTITNYLDKQGKQP